jgi:Tfp pilus assembly protein PilF
VSSAGQFEPRGPRRVGRWIGVLAVLVGLGVAGASVWHWRRQRQVEVPPRAAVSDDPRLNYRGEFTNIHPDAVYVDNDARCAPCHADICATYRVHPMARSLTAMADLAERENLGADRRNPFTALNYRFSIERKGREIWHHLDRDDEAGKPLLGLSWPVHYAVGSGARGRSYLTDRDGALYQTPISWFSQKQFWDLSPGFGPLLLSGRPVDGQCLFCHANRAHFRENSVNHFEEPIFSGLGIGCERCHGPAERHVETQGKWDVVNPNNLSSVELRDAVCEQCHLKGKMRVLRRERGLDDYRPGLPLSAFFRVFVEADGHGKAKSVSEAEQMHESRCYQASLESKDKPMVCVSCHDPHRHIGPAERVAHYRTRCLSCHESIPCKLSLDERHRRQPDDSCIACHMPRFGTIDIVHTAATNHRIPRIPPKTKPEEQAPPGNLDLKPFHPYPPEEEAEVRRDLGVAWVELMKISLANPQVHGETAEALLAGAIRQHPNDVPAREAMGFSLFLRGRQYEALDQLESVLSLDPKREWALNAVAALTWKLGRPEESLGYWRRLVAESPWQPAYRRALTEILIHMGERAEARTQCQAWLRLDPMSVDARRTWIHLLLRDNRRNEAREQLRLLEALKAPDLDRVRAWFDEEER